MSFYQRVNKWFQNVAGAIHVTPAQHNIGLINPYGSFPRPVASVPLGDGQNTLAATFQRPVAHVPLGNGQDASTPYSPIGVRPSPSVPLGNGAAEGYSYSPGGESSASPVGHPLLPSPYRGGEM